MSESNLLARKCIFECDHDNGAFYVDHENMSLWVRWGQKVIWIFPIYFFELTITEKMIITWKGKYEISFKFTLEDAYGKPYKENLDDLFKIMPQQGTLIPVDRPTQVQVMFKSHSEINIQELPILKCHVIEPNMSETGETIASIPIKITGWF